MRDLIIDKFLSCITGVCFVRTRKLNDCRYFSWFIVLQPRRKVFQYINIIRGTDYAGKSRCKQFDTEGVTEARTTAGPSALPHPFQEAVELMGRSRVGLPLNATIR